MNIPAKPNIRKPAKKHKKYSELPPNHKKIVELMSDGICTTDIAKITNMHRDSISRLKPELSKFALSYDKQLARKGKKVAHKIYKDFMSDSKHIKASDALALLKMQQDRIDPVVNKTESTSVNLIAVVNMDKYK